MTELLDHERSRGAILLHRRIKDLAWYRGLSGQHRHVLTELIWMARWADGLVPYYGRELPLCRGQIFAGENHIAAEANVSRKVVRTTLALLVRVGFLGQTSGPSWGPKSKILTIINYSSYQSLDNIGGQRSGQSRGQTGAIVGPRKITRDHKKRSLLPKEIVSTEDPIQTSAIDPFADAPKARAARAPRQPALNLVHSAEEPKAKSLHHECIERFVESYRQNKHDTPPAIQGPDVKQLQTLLRAVHDLTPEEFSRRLDIAWQDNFFRDKHASLQFFCGKWNAYADREALRPNVLPGRAPPKLAYAKAQTREEFLSEIAAESAGGEA